MIFQSAVNRPTPSLGPQWFKTFEVNRPRNTHFRKAKCTEVECPNNQRGWRTVCDVSTALGKSQANYIRLKSGRSFTVEQSGDLTTFTFPAGQMCFSDHRVPLDREPFFRKLSGDWRQYGEAKAMRAVDWLDDFGNHQQNLAEQRERG